jgi:hypothetical protein
VDSARRGPDGPPGFPFASTEASDLTAQLSRALAKKVRHLSPFLKKRPLSDGHLLLDEGSLNDWQLRSCKSERVSISERTSHLIEYVGTLCLQSALICIALLFQSLARRIVEVADR